MSVFFSIIIPTYNRGSILEKTIQSVLLQSYPHYELIVVDDGSSDDTRAVMEKILEKHSEKKIRYFYKKNGERGAARNFGLKQAKGDFVNFFDSDDVLYPHHLEVAAGFIQHNPNALFFHLRYDIKDDAGNLLSYSPQFHSPPNRHLIKGNFLSCNGVFIQKELAADNPFSEDRRLAGTEDWELWLRLSVKQPIYYINTITSTIIQHASRSVLHKDKNKLILCIELVLSETKNNKDIQRYYRKDFYKFEASCYSYVALHLALMKHQKKDVFRYLFKTLRCKPHFVFERRFFAILKHLF